MCRKYTSLAANPCEPGNDKFAFADQFVTFRVSWPQGVPFPYRPCERHMPIIPREPPIECIFPEVIGRKILSPSATYEKN